VLGRSLAVDGVLTKTCERCDGRGVIEQTRHARLTELSDGQIRALTEANLYRETGDVDEDEIEQQQAQARQMQRGVGRGGAVGGHGHAPTPPSGSSGISGPTPGSGP